MMLAESKLFQQTAQDFARSTDRLIQLQRYYRGELFLDEVRRQVPPGSSILDYGCGPGRIAVMLAAAGYEVDGVDPALEMIEEARAHAAQQAARVRFEVLRSAWHPQGRTAYDAVVCSSVIEYVPDPVALLHRLKTYLRPGGLLTLSFANKLSLRRKYAQLRNGASTPHFTVQRHVWTAKDCIELLREVGFREIQGPVFFESGFDAVRWLRFLSATPLFGQLGLLSARRR